MWENSTWVKCTGWKMSQSHSCLWYTRKLLIFHIYIIVRTSIWNYLHWWPFDVISHALHKYKAIPYSIWLIFKEICFNKCQSNIQICITKHLRCIPEGPIIPKKAKCQFRFKFWPKIIQTNQESKDHNPHYESTSIFKYYCCRL